VKRRAILPDLRRFLMNLKKFCTGLQQKLTRPEKSLEKAA